MPGGANNPASFRNLLRDGVDGTREVPWDRWDQAAFYDSDPDRAGKMYTSRGGFLDRIDGFDPGFFRMSPREAASLDPQQRLLLEVSWEAIEDAGMLPEKLVGSRTGVFVGIGVDDYARRQLKAGREVDAYSGTGNAFCFASGRLSWFFGLQGPSLSLDTACSSSLVTVHLACQSLRNRECDQALAGGVNAMLSPEAGIFLSRAKALSPDGRCKTFDASADGYSRSEGCGMLVLRRLSDALAAGDRILALIRGSAVNHDGPSSGLTVPNPQAQQAVIRQALKNAGVEPSKIGYLEAHGTGTALGDPIEIRALTEVFAGRALPLFIGSVKTNIGHLETGAGVAGLIKVILSLQYEELPPHLHFSSANPHLSLARVPASLTASLTPWPRTATPRLAGVSAFGLSGTNAHIVLEEAPAAQPAAAPRQDAQYHLRISARTPEALARMARLWSEWLELPEIKSTDLRDICYTAAARRSLHRHVLSVSGTTHAALASALNLVLAGEAPVLSPAAIIPGEGRVVSLPLYPFERQRCWFEEEIVRDFDLSGPDRAWLNDHRIYGTCIFPATGYLSLAARAGASGIRDLSIAQALILPDNSQVTLRFIVKPGGNFRFMQGEQVYATGRIDSAESGRGLRAKMPEAVAAANEADQTSGAAFYARLREYGFDYGPAFQCIREVRRVAGEVWSRVELPSALAMEPASWPVHPALLDACMQSLGFAFDHLASESDAWLPVTVDRLHVYTPHHTRVWCRVPAESRPENAAFQLFDDDGIMVAELAGLRLRRTRREALLGAATRNSPAAFTEDCFYKLSWVATPRLPASSHDAMQGEWLIVGGGVVAAQLASGFRSRGAIVHLAGVDQDFPRGRNLRGAIHLAGLDSAEPAVSCRSLLRLAQSQTCPLWMVTCGADEASPGNAAIWGFGRTLALEHPEQWGGLIDLDPHRSALEQVALLEDEITSPDAERQVQFRNGSRLGARIIRASLPTGAAVIHPEATYLVTGGTGALGQRAAAMLKAAGARNVVIAGRHAPIPVDISREDDVLLLLDRIAREMPLLKGIIHAAGVLDDALIAEQDWSRFERVFAPKVNGALLLDRHTAHLDLDFFVLFSAFSTFTGSPGQVSYVAANSFLDAFAANRRSRGLHTVSIGWGPFAEAGMSARLGPRHAAQRAAWGIRDLSPAAGMEILSRLLQADTPQTGVLQVDWVRFVAASATAPPPLFAELGIAGAGATSRQPLRETLLQNPSGHTEIIRHYLQHEIATQLRYPAGELPQPDLSLTEMGFDSLLTLELRNRLSRHLGMEISMGIFFESSTLEDLISALENQLRTSAPSNGHRPGHNRPPPSDPLAELQGMSEEALEALLNELSVGDPA